MSGSTTGLAVIGCFLISASLALSGQQPVLVLQQWQFKPIMDNGRPRPYRALLIFKF